MQANVLISAGKVFLQKIKQQIFNLIEKNMLLFKAI